MASRSHTSCLSIHLEPLLQEFHVFIHIENLILNGFTAFNVETRRRFLMFLQNLLLPSNLRFSSHLLHMRFVLLLRHSGAFIRLFLLFCFCSSSVSFVVEGIPMQ